MQSGEKVLVLKRKYRGIPIESTPNASSRHLPKRPAPKANYKDPSFLNVTNANEGESYGVGKLDISQTTHKTCDVETIIYIICYS